MTSINKTKLIVLLCLSGLLVVSAAFSALATMRAVNVSAASGQSAGAIIPLYTDPSDSSWSTLISSKESNPSVPMIAIINPDNGPGSSKDSSYTSGITSLENAGIIVIGYIATGYGTSSYSSTSNIENQINEYKSWYPNIQGIFFDEMSSSGSEASYYSTLSSYAQSQGLATTVGNPGTTVDSSLVGTMSILCIYENPGMPSTSELSGYSSDGPNGFAMIAYSISSMPSQSTVSSITQYTSWIYITSLGGSNPYDGLPSYWSSEVSTLASIDSSSSNSPLPVSSSSTTTSTTRSTTSTTTTTSTTSTSSTVSSSTAGGTTYTVQPGDYLYLIGLKFGVTWQSIASANGISSPYYIYVGEVLVIPTQSSSSSTYIVQAGDCLYAIGLKLGVSWQSIASANDITSPYMIYVGEVLTIPH